MVQPGIGLDTPRTNLGDATYLTHQPDFDISQEQSFQSPSKDNNNLVDLLQNGRRGGGINLRTPRSRAVLNDRRNLPNAFGGGEFTPLLKSATRNSALRFGKENGVPRTPAFLKPGGLDNIVEDLSPVPQIGSSVYGEDSRNVSYISGTPIPQVEGSSVASTPMALLPRRNDGANILQDGNQLSLREQENVIDKIEKENFGLKLKIHFLEEALRKAGPGFSEAALKENTELKVDKVTMQKELHRYRRTLTTAERDLETYRQQIMEMQEKVKRKHADEGAREELDRLQHALQEKELEIEELLQKLKVGEAQDNQVEKLRDDIGDLEADLREKDRLIDERDDEVDNLKAQITERDGEITEFERVVKAAKRRELELEEKAQSNEELEDARETIAGLEEDLKRITLELREAKEDRDEAVAEKERASADLEELQDEMANKSITTKGLSRQIEEKANRLQDELEEYKERHEALVEQHILKTHEIESAHQQRDAAVGLNQTLSTQVQSAQDELRRKTDERDLLHARHVALTSESAGLQKELARSRATIEDLEEKLNFEKTLALKAEREFRDQYKSELDQLNDEIEDLRADVREKERLYDDDNDKWDSERRNLESQRIRAEEQAADLKQTINKLQQSEGTLSSKEEKLQQVLQVEKERHAREETALSRQIEELNDNVESRRNTLEELRTKLSVVEEELRLSQREQKSLSEKVECLEDEIEVLQTSLDDESDRAKAELDGSERVCESLQRQIDSLKEELLNTQLRGSEEQMNGLLHDLETQLTKVRKEKQDLNDQLAKVNLLMHSLKSAAADAEAERDEVKSQLRVLQQHEEDTFRPDQEKIELRTSKMKLDSEVRRLREETKVLLEEKVVTERMLQDSIERATNEESRLRQKESEFQQRDAVQKDALRTLKRQISELERRSHDMEISRLQTSSPQSSANGSARKSEIIEVRLQLANAHQNLKDLRIQFKEGEREAARKLSSTTLELQKKTTAWDTEKDSLEHDVEKAILAKEELKASCTNAESTILRLRSKISRLEKELQNERKNSGEDRTIALERRSLHEMLRETQVQAEELELKVKSRDAALDKITIAEADLRAQLKRVRDERSSQRHLATTAVSELEKLERDYRIAKQSWEDEKRSLSRGVRFTNTSISELRGNESLIRESEEKDKRHTKELRGLAMQIEWLRAKCRREENLRSDAAFAKRYMTMQIDLFNACNAADLQILESMGIKPERTPPKKTRSLRVVAKMVLASVRMKRGAEQWAKSRKVHERLLSCLETMKRKSRKSLVH